MLTFGTAGHIDHGKSSLVKALTSIDPDRLPEEKKRGMTIDLGFAWMDLPSGETIGIIDVPGHKQFVHNVIPGLFSIDAALLVVAADDGWMPQTEEHLRILDLLGVRCGIVALNKVDLITDAEWLEEVQKDVASRLAGTNLENAPIIRVSTRSGIGITELTQAIDALAQKLSPRQDIGKPRLPIDRVFVIKGSGVVVTGTLSQGIFHTGDAVNITPSGLSTRIRSMESFKKNTSVSAPGVRVALNLAGLKRTDVHRGDIVTAERQSPLLSRFLDAHLTLLSDAEIPLKNMAEVLVYLETRELLGRISIIGAKTLEPGESALVQLRFQEDVSAFIGERFIIRRQSPARTIGGGVVLDPLAEKLKLSATPERVAFLQKRLTQDLDTLILSEISKKGWAETQQLLLNSLHSTDDILAHVKQLSEQKLLVLAADYAVQPAVWQDNCLKVLSAIDAKYKTNPIQAGTPQAAIQKDFAVPPDIFDALVQQLVAKGKLVRQNDVLYLPGNASALSPQQESLRQTILGMFATQVTTPPTLSEIGKRLANSLPVAYYLVKQGLLVDFGGGVLLEKAHFEGICREVTVLLKQNGHVSIQDINQHFGLSRKYSVPLLTYLDRLGITRREGDVRVAGKKLL
ncbi:MAG: selenocysteine-specific translation elongation factor [Dehalococcoidia bacterium]|nr:selenocysteine-specific translation elongation factor [Dehalococcoidia bacterium]